MTTGRRVGWLVVLAVVVPIVIVTLYLFVSRRIFVYHGGPQDVFAIAAACVAGAWGLVACMPRHWTRVLAVVTYFPFAGAVLFFYVLLFVCGMFGDCL